MREPCRLVEIGRIDDLERKKTLRKKSRTTLVAADLASPRWYAARFAKSGSSVSFDWSKNAKSAEQTVGRRLRPPIELGAAYAAQWIELKR
jgi:hypothetical protein